MHAAITMQQTCPLVFLHPVGVTSFMQATSAQCRSHDPCKECTEKNAGSHKKTCWELQKESTLADVSKKKTLQKLSVEQIPALH